MFAKVIALCLLATVALARPDKPAPRGYGYAPPSPAPSYGPPQQTYGAPSSEEEHEEGMPFDFSFEVEDEYKGVDFAHDANSDGNVVTGEYRVALPDGRTQIVTYTADWKNGYQAEVTYEGEAQYPSAESYEVEPSYSAPKSLYGTPNK